MSDLDLSDKSIVDLMQQLDALIFNATSAPFHFVVMSKATRDCASMLRILTTGTLFLRKPQSGESVFDVPSKPDGNLYFKGRQVVIDPGLPDGLVEYRAKNGGLLGCLSLVEPRTDPRFVVRQRDMGTPDMIDIMTGKVM